MNMNSAKEIACCDLFRIRVRNAGKEGTSILIKELLGGFAFVLQFRSVAYDEVPQLQDLMGKLGAADADKRLSIRVGNESVIHFCPFCGCNLKKLVRSNQNLATSLAGLHSKWILFPRFPENT